MRLQSSWLLLTVPACLVAAGLLVATIGSLVRTLRSSMVAAIPLQPDARVPLPGPGRYDLYIEGPLGTRDFAGLDFELSDASGRAIPAHAVLFRTRVSSFSRARLHVRSFELAAGSAIGLRVTGIRDAADRDDRILIGRPVQGRMLAHILALVLLGALTIGSLVGSILILAGPRTAARS